MMNYEDTLKQLVLDDEKYIVMTAENRAAIRNLPALLGERFIDVGIAEQTMVGAAAGLASRGRVPILHALSTFLVMRAFEFIRTDVGIAGLPVKLIGAVPGFLSEANGPTHQAIEDIALMRGIPGMTIFCPADEQDLVTALPGILNSPDPAYVRHNALPPVTEHKSDFEIGKAEIVSEGTDAAILVYGMLFREAFEAAELLRSQNISVRLVNLRTVWPIDEKEVIHAVKSCKLVVTLEDHFAVGGLYSIVCEILTRNKVTSDILPFYLDNHWFKPALLDDVLRYEGFSAEQIAVKIKTALHI